MCSPRTACWRLGCGHGVAVTLISERLAGGTVVGLDRSPKMTAAATRRNAKHVASGRARILTTSLQDANLGDTTFDKVLAVHYPPLQRGDAAPELPKVRGHLARQGALYVVAAPLTADQVQATARAIAGRLTASGFAPEPARIADVDGQRLVCVVACPDGPQAPRHDPVNESKGEHLCPSAMDTSQAFHAGWM